MKCLRTSMFLVLWTQFALAADGPVVVLTAKGETISGSLERMDKEWNVTVRDEKGEHSASGADLIGWSRMGTSRPAYPAGPHLVFANGDRLPGHVQSIDKDVVKFRTVLGRDSTGEVVRELAIPLSAVAVIWFRAPPLDSGEEWLARWTAERRRRDLVLLNNGDTRIGVVENMKSPTSALSLKEDARSANIEPGHVVAIAMNTDLARSLRPRGPYARLVLANGTRLSLLSGAADSKELTARTLFGANVMIPVSEITALEVRQGKAVFLSDLKPKAYEHTPFLGVRWPVENDRSLVGQAIRLGGHVYDKGVALHSDSKLTYDLGGNYRRFETLVGLDDVAGQGGNVRLRVLVDGKPKWETGSEVTAATPPLAVRVEVTGGKELTLCVEFGAGGDVCDHVNWADARLIK